VESAAGQVPPTGESVAELLARIERQAALLSEGRAREAAKDAVIESLQERAAAQDAKTAGGGPDREDGPGFSELLQAAVLGRARYAG
jgi:hypothetical protein